MSADDQRHAVWGLKNRPLWIWGGLMVCVFLGNFSRRWRK